MQSLSKIPGALTTSMTPDTRGNGCTVPAVRFWVTTRHSPPPPPTAPHREAPDRNCGSPLHVTFHVPEVAPPVVHPEECHLAEAVNR